MRGVVPQEYVAVEAVVDRVVVIGALTTYSRSRQLFGLIITDVVDRNTDVVVAPPVDNATLRASEHVYPEVHEKL